MGAGWRLKMALTGGSRLLKKKNREGIRGVAVGLAGLVGHGSAQLSSQDFFSFFK
jgi:hypothetical protein